MTDLPGVYHNLLLKFTFDHWLQQTRLMINCDQLGKITKIYIIAS